MKRTLIHPLASARWKLFWKLHRRHRPFNRASRLQRLLAYFSVFVRTPFYWLEDLIFKRRLARREIGNGPIFIVGHWRSGTTHLHNLLSQDEQFGFLSFSHMGMPHDMLVGRYLPIIPMIVKMTIPETRGIDQLDLKSWLPQEEEMTLGMMNPLSYYHCYTFPRHWDEYFEASIAMTGVDEEGRKAFLGAYEKLVRKLAARNGGKTVLLKNPPSTARMTMLKEVFPRARFVHIRRNPYEVFVSSRARLPKLVGVFSWEDAEGIDYDRITLDSYRILMERYFEQRDTIPSDDLFETSYEELTADPKKVVGEIYAKFGLERSEASVNRLSEYLDSQKDYRKNVHRLTRSQLQQIESEWAFAFREWNYEMPPDLEVVD